MDSAILGEIAISVSCLQYLIINYMVFANSLLIEFLRNPISSATGIEVSRIDFSRYSVQYYSQ